MSDAAAVGADVNIGEDGMGLGFNSSLIFLAQVVQHWL